MRSRLDTGLRIMVALGCLALAFAFFQPWIQGPGGPISAPHLRENLEGPHRFLSLFSGETAVSRNYALAPWLWAIPAAAGLALLFAAFPHSPAWPGGLCGLISIAAALYLRREVAAMPFHREAWGTGLTLRLGAVLLALSLLRTFTRRGRKSR
jgi:hypothetical protein